jgi:hypothetical protein
LTSRHAKGVWVRLAATRAVDGGRARDTSPVDAGRQRQPSVPEGRWSVLAGCLLSVPASAEPPPSLNPSAGRV